LKPENILFEDKSFDSRIKLIDFGGSKINQLSRMHTFLGTAFYIAPEVISGEYTEKCDVWSIGVILYIMLCGKPPFSGKSLDEIFSKIQKSEPKFEGSAWRQVSESCKSLLRKTLEKSSKKRISISELFYDPWLSTRSKDLVADRAQARRVFDQFMHFKTTNKLQTCILAFLTHQSSTTEKIRDLRQLFEEIDKDKDGKLSRSEVKQAIEDFGSSLRLTVDEIFMQCDFDQNGFIEFSEFVTAVQSKELEYTGHNLRKAFLALDKNGDGKISKDEVREVLGDLNDEGIEQVFQQLDKDGSGEIDDVEFFEAFFQYSAVQETESSN
jgi:calcium-dependent protein kinase